MFKNIRYLYKLIGSTDISSLEDGTITGNIDRVYIVLIEAKVKIKYL